MSLAVNPLTSETPVDAEGAGIGIVHQEIPICPHMTAAENIFLGRNLPKRGGLINWNEVNRRAQELFEMFQADINPKDVVSRLSIAKQQMIEIAQALSLDAKLIIMDEPTSALGKRETERLFQIIQDLVEQGLTIIYVSHRLEEVFEIADSITALRDGEYIKTVAKDTVTPDDVVHMMVGREIDDLFPKTYNEIGKKPLLSVRGLSDPERYQDVSV